MGVCVCECVFEGECEDVCAYVSVCLSVNVG